jgi:hypothetical protein
MVPRATLTALLLAFSGVVWAAENPPTENPATEKSVGMAHMLENGTILVGVSGPDADSQAQAVLMVQPGDSTYQPLLDHIGGLKPGETKPIPPWPASPPPKKDVLPSDSPPGA